MTEIITPTEDLLHVLLVGSSTARHSTRNTDQALAVHFEALAGGLLRVSSQDGAEFSRCCTPATITATEATTATVYVIDAAGLIKLTAAMVGQAPKLQLSITADTLTLSVPGDPGNRLRTLANSAGHLLATSAPSPTLESVPTPPRATLPAGMLADITHSRHGRTPIQLHGVAGKPELIAWTQSGYAHGRVRMDPHAEQEHSIAVRWIQAHEARPAAS